MLEVGLGLTVALNAPVLRASSVSRRRYAAMGTALILVPYAGACLAYGTVIW